MPEMRMNRNFILKGTSIPTIHFVKDEPKWVTDVAVNDALKYGAEFVDEEIGKALDEKRESNTANQPKQAPEGVVLEQEIFDVFGGLVAVNAREHFTANGTPRVDILKDKLGYDVDSKTVLHYWTKFTQIREGRGTEESE